MGHAIQRRPPTIAEPNIPAAFHVRVMRAQTGDTVQVANPHLPFLQAIPARHSRTINECHLLD